MYFFDGKPKTLNYHPNCYFEKEDYNTIKSILNMNQIDTLKLYYTVHSCYGILSYIRFDRNSLNIF